MKDLLHIYCDGACLPVTPGGVATWAFVVHRGMSTVYQRCGVEIEGPGATNNVAEYAAVYHALVWATGTTDLHNQIYVYSDSQLIINQLTGQYQCNSPALRQWRQKCLALAAEVRHVEFRWIPREENADADALTLRAYQEHQRHNTHSPRHGEHAMKLNEAFPSKYIKAEDFPAARIMTIYGCRIEEIGQQKDQKLVIYFHHEAKGLVCNKTVASQIAFVTGSDDTDHWAGKQIELYRDMVPFQGKMVAGLRVRAPQVPSQQQPPQNGGQYAPPQNQPPIAPPQQQARPNMAPPNAVYDQDIVPDPGDPMTARDRARPSF